jgi:1,4-dihydroxy-2-naphthoyl-CoA hydrolase
VQPSPGCQQRKLTALPVVIIAGPTQHRIVQQRPYLHQVCLGDTDAAGVIYFAKALDVAHRAYETALADAGLPLASLLAAGRWALPVVRCESDYRRPVGLGQTLMARVGLRSLGERSARVVVVLELPHGEAAPIEACRLLLIIACLDRQAGVSAPFPPEIRDSLAALGQTLR